MYYISTRDAALRCTASQAIVQGLSRDGGLFLPERIPALERGALEKMRTMPYAERAVQVMKLYLEEFTEDELRTYAGSAYGADKFDTPAVAPLKRLDGALKDFAFIYAIPGRKILLKGNHDYWWSTAVKFYRFCAEHGFEDLYVLNNNCYFYGDTALCGTRGWFYEEDKQVTHDEKVFRRELGRLETSLKAAGDAEKLCFLHYPPKYSGYECPEILELLRSYGVRLCCYGHLHAESLRLAFQGRDHDVDLRCLSADYVNFIPQKLMD